MAELIDGRLVSQHIRDNLKKKVSELRENHSVIPGLAVIIVGDDPASKVYVRNKKRGCDEVGINSFEISMPADVSEDELVCKIEELNTNKYVHGILVQLPLPKHINTERIITSISPEKDVDAFHPLNVGRILTGNYRFLPCTPSGIISLLDYYKVEISGKKCVVLGRSNIVGKPMALLLLERNGTVTICHSKTENLVSEIKSADILVVAVGKGNFVKGDMIKPGAVVIDVGINRTPEGQLVGDVDFNSVSAVASLLTPVPGGVGPMTITTLLKNTVVAAERAITL